MQEEAVGDEHQVAVGPVLSREQKVLDRVWVQQWFAAEESETLRMQAMGPERIVGIGLLDGWHRACEMMIRVMAALLAREVATVGQVVFQRGKRQTVVHRLVPFLILFHWRKFGSKLSKGATMSVPKRKLDFHTADEVIGEIESLRNGGYSKLKRWNLTQACEHLTKTIEGEMNGLGFRIPWILRRTVGNWMTRRVLKTRSMPSAPTLPSLRPAAGDVAEDPAVIEQCIATIRKAEIFNGSLDDYPFVDGLSHDEWRQFMWIHAAHYLGFLVPIETSN